MASQCAIVRHFSAGSVSVTLRGDAGPADCKTDRAQQGGDMFLRVSVYPPLDHDNVVSEDKVTLHVLLESERENDEWEVQLWHDHDDHVNWRALAFRENNSHVIRSAGPAKRRTWYVAKLQGRPSGSRTVTSYTVRFRQRGTENWKWIRDVSGVNDGRLLYQSALPQSNDVGDYVNGMSPDIKASRVPSETSDTLVWSLEASASSAKGESSGISKHDFGNPKDFSRWFALVRLWTPWLAPRQGRGSHFAREDGILYAFQRHDGLFLVVLGISGIENIITTLQANENGGLTLSARSDSETEGVSRSVVSLGLSLDTALAAAIYQARKTVTALAPLSAEHQALVDAIETKAEEKDVQAAWVENWYDCMGYCTWNGLGKRLTVQKIQDALHSFRQQGVGITTLIIDDNWQSLDAYDKESLSTGWTEFEAQRDGFPDGLKAGVSAIRASNPQLKYVAVWHALLGYWGGVSPHGNIAHTYRTRRVHRGPTVKGGTTLVVDQPDVKALYHDFYGFLADAGVDAVKTDVQFMLDEVQEASARRRLTPDYQDEWSISHLRHFAGRGISCMSQTPSILFHSQLPTTVPATVVRNSDDFFPEVPASHPWHIFCNAHNALFTKYLNVVPDWDMFQTGHEWGAFHAAARCVSGGPIYITDAPGKHDMAVIHHMTAQTGRGNTVILRPSVVGRSLNAFVGFEDERLCLVGAYDGPSLAGSSFVGVFNCRPHAITEIVHLESYLGTEQGDWVVRSFTDGQVGSVMSRSRPDEAVEAVAVDGHQWQILTARPVTTLDEKARVADFGLVDKMTGAAAILSSQIRLAGVESKDLQVKATLKALGQWGVWLDLQSASKEPSVDDMLVLLEDNVVPRHCVAWQPLTSSSPTAGMLSVDLARAWRELGLAAQYTNEVHAEASVRLG